jgi:hypothetical protein
MLGLLAVLGGVFYWATRKEEAENAQLSRPASPPPATRATPPPPPTPLLPKTDDPPEEQKRVNEAIDRGVEYLKRGQRADGTWSPNDYLVGLAALPGLTLLECGVPRNDQHIQLAAFHVRSALPRLNQTYELSLCILFLDRLGEPSDRPLIQTMALRLIAGQRPTGGWVYTCPLLSPLEESQLMEALRKTRPASNRELFMPAQDDKSPPELANSGELPNQEEKKPAAKPPQPESLAKVHATLPLRLKRVAALTPLLPGTFPAHDEGGPTDNSNTQFAILGLWAAGRHEVPTERALALLVKRFRFSQTGDGGWVYYYPPGSSAQSPAMTGAGLLGLAVGHGLVRSGDNAVRGAIQDPAIDRGMQSIARSIGKPLRGNVHLYFLWTLERVGVLYNQRTLAKKDWYAWGARLLLERQGKDGHWAVGGYPGSQPLVDTCFALLFLKRANLTHDLSQKLEFFVEGKAPAPAPPLREQK